MKAEVWKPVPGWEGWYEVSDHGRVRSCEREVVDTNKHGFTRTRKYKPKILKGSPVGPAGHLTVSLCRNGRGERPLVHRLVASSFLPNPEGYPVVDHIDGDPSNNAARNLRWANYCHNNANTPYVRYLMDKLAQAGMAFASPGEFYAV